MQFHPTIPNRRKLDIEANLHSFFRDSRCILKGSIPQTDKIQETSISPLTAKDRFNLKHPEINQAYYTDFTRSLLLSFYPKTCKCGSTEFKAISTRETEIRCTKCKAHISLTSYTPAHHLKTPLWTLGYLIKEAIDLSPMPLTSACISKKLKVGNSTAITLKRRIQLFLSDMIPSIKHIMAQDIKKDFPDGFTLPPKTEDITGLVEGKNVVFSDTLALFSASPRANGFRARYKHTGQTSSIYLSDEVALEKGKYQIGTLCHTLAIKGGPVLFTSVPDQTQKTIQPLLDFLPENHPHFSDEGFPWLARLNDNFRCVNHSARAKNLKRNVWARNRWSKLGTHNQVAEGNQRALKTCMRNYSYVSPEYSQMYLDEFSALKAIKIYGLVKLAEVRKFGESSVEILISEAKRARCDRYLKNKISTLKYIPPTPETRTHLNFSKSRKEIPKALKDILKFNDYFDLNQAVWDYLYFWDEPNKKRKQLETEINSQAMKIFRMMSENKSISLKSIANASTVPYRRAIRIARIWAKLNVAEVTQFKSKGHRDKVVYYVRRLIPTLTGLLYTYDRDFFENQPVDWNGVEIFDDTSEPTIKGKYGLTKIQRINKLKEAGIEI